MKLRKVLAIPLAVLATAVVIAGCTSSGSGNGDTQEGAQQSADTTQMELVLPLPKFQYSFLRYEFIVMEAFQAFGLSSHSFFFQQGDRTPVGDCPSIGLPIPVDSSLSNPWQPQTVGNNTGGWNAVAVGQMDPTGIYVGPTSGTYILCKTANGGTYLSHAEENVHTVTAQAYWDPSMYGGKGGIHVAGQPQLPVCTDVRKKTVTASDGSKTTEYSTMCYRPGHVPAGVKAPDFSGS